MFKFIITLSLLATNSFAQDNIVYFYDDFHFEEGSTQVLFGDNVQLRKKPTTKSKSLDTLDIGTKITIVEKSKETMLYDGINWNWYKVEHDGQKGFILGSLISLTTAEVHGYKYVTTVVDKGDYDRFIEYRMLKSEPAGGAKYLSGESHLMTSSFSLDVSDNRGVEGIEHILFVNYWSEACGMDGGGVYVFYDGKDLVEAIDVSSIVDGGVFWFFEDLIFPADEKGEKGFVIYERERGEAEDEEFFWERSVANRVYLRWEDGRFSPDIKELKFDED